MSSFFHGSWTRDSGKMKMMPRFLLLLAVAACHAQTQNTDDDAQKWNLFFQATSIGQFHPAFDAAYSGPLSLAAHAEAEVSLTSTLFFGWQAAKHTQFYFDPEIAGGRAFSGTTGIANFPNGEMPRVATATPKPYLARVYVQHDFGFGPEMEKRESDENQLGNARPMTRYTIVAGRFTVTDFFDQNRYSHDPRTQFMGWAVMYNGAWDYPADTRGYTWGWVHEFHTRRWSARYGSAAMPRVANGLRFDRRLFRDRSDMFEGEYRTNFSGHEGAVRVLHYQNRGDMGSYAGALRMPGRPDVTATRRIGALKYGFGMSADQEIAKGLGLFSRLGWNDGKTESFAFTVMDRLATIGVSLDGSRWNRPNDTIATEVTAAGLSAVHAAYLSRGGLDFLIGDGALRYGRETTSETYYQAKLTGHLFVSLDLQHIANPAYNRDRGPVWAPSLRLHVTAGR